MAKYKVNFSGFAYVEAGDENEAMDMYQSGDTVYEENEVGEVIEVNDFTVEI